MTEADVIEWLRVGMAIAGALLGAQFWVVREILRRPTEERIDRRVEEKIRASECIAQIHGDIAAIREDTAVIRNVLGIDGGRRPPG